MYRSQVVSYDPSHVPSVPPPHEQVEGLVRSCWSERGRQTHRVLLWVLLVCVCVRPAGHDINTTERSTDLRLFEQGAC